MTGAEPNTRYVEGVAEERGSFDPAEPRPPLAAAAMDVPRGRKRPGWKEEVLRAVQEAAGELPPLSEDDILKAVRQYRRESRVHLEIRLAAKG